MRFPKLKLRFGLRTLLVLIVLVAIPCALFGRRLRASYLSSQLTRLTSSDRVMTVADKKYFRWGLEAADGADQLTFWEVDWEWRDLIDADLQLLKYLKLEGEHIRDQDVTTIGIQDHLTKLVLADTSVTDETIRRLQGCTKLEILSLYGSQHVRGDGFEAIEKLGSIKVLELSHTGVVDSSLIHLSRMPNLIRLDLGHTQITDKGVCNLKGAANLQSLWLNDTHIKGKGVATLSLLPSLVGLNLSNTPLECGVFEQCEIFPSLKHLSIANTELGDVDLLRIAEVSNLESIGLQNTRVSDLGVERFIELEPSCKIHRK